MIDSALIHWPQRVHKGKNYLSPDHKWTCWFSGSGGNARTKPPVSNFVTWLQPVQELPDMGVHQNHWETLPGACWTRTFHGGLVICIFRTIPQGILMHSVYGTVFGSSTKIIWHGKCCLWLKGSYGKERNTTIRTLGSLLKIGINRKILESFLLSSTVS